MPTARARRRFVRRRDHIVQIDAATLPLLLVIPGRRAATNPESSRAAVRPGLRVPACRRIGMTRRRPQLLAHRLGSFRHLPLPAVLTCRPITDTHLSPCGAVGESLLVRSSERRKRFEPVPGGFLTEGLRRLRSFPRGLCRSARDPQFLVAKLAALA